MYVTSDLRHHPVTDAIEQARYEASMRAADIELGRGDATVRPMFVNTPHSAIESIWFQYAMGDVPRAVSEATGDIPTVRWISMNTDPGIWYCRPAGRNAERRCPIRPAWICR